MAKTESSALKTAATGLVPVKLKVSEAGLGFRAGEIRGFAPEIAAKMITKGHAEAVDPKSKTGNEGTPGAVE